MTNENNGQEQNTSWWIVSLAISVVCCAILFVVFASYLVTVKENMAVSKLRFEVIDQRMNTMSSELEYLRRRSTVQQIQIIPAGGVAVTPENAVSAVVGAQAPAAATTAPQSSEMPSPASAQPAVTEPSHVMPKP